MKDNVPGRARSLLYDAANALEEECAAAGLDEVRVHPTLKAHSQLASRIRRYLKSTQRT